MTPMIALLPGRDVLVAVGMCLFMLGLVLRGLASANRRNLARRKQHLRDERRSNGPGAISEMDQPPDWLERNLGRVANLVLVVGVVLTVFAYWRG